MKQLNKFNSLIVVVLGPQSIVVFQNQSNFMFINNIHICQHVVNCFDSFSQTVYKINIDFSVYYLPPCQVGNTIGASKGGAGGAMAPQKA